MVSGKFSIKKRLRSFVYAFNGLRILIREEHNSRIHLFITGCVAVAGWLLKISSIEWITILLCIGLVIALELVNSAIENLANYVSPEKRAIIKKTKDLSAGAVLIGAIIAAIVGVVIFLPKIL